MKRNLTEEKLIELGFEKIIVPVEESQTPIQLIFLRLNFFS
jgi:hypothetical protein